MAVDDFTRYKISGFIKKKSDMKSFATEVLSKMKSAGHEVKFVGDHGVHCALYSATERRC